jgi:hypothetical protein
MFSKPTVFVVGAGASAECKLPTGAQLSDLIKAGVRFRFDPHGSGQMEGDTVLLRALRLRFGKDQATINRYTTSSNELAATMSTFPSVDEALHWWRSTPEIVDLGKAAIAHYVLQAERNSVLKYSRENGRVNVDAANDTWLAPFLSIAVSALSRDESNAIFQNVTLINFNYDRTVEHYLVLALQQRTGLSKEMAERSVAQLDIIRPYGSLGKLDWQGGQGPFGGSEHDNDLFKIAANIQTFTEQAAEPDVAKSIDDALSKAVVVIFLGFGFHQQNLSLFKTSRGPRDRMAMVAATSLGIDELNYPSIKNQLRKVLRFNGDPELVDCQSHIFLRKLRPSISVAVS